MDKEEIINYVMETPGNSNPAVLRGMLDSQGSNKKDIVIVTVTLDPPTNTYTCDKTFQELVELYSQGAFLALKQASTISAMPDEWAYLHKFVHSAFIFEHTSTSLAVDHQTITDIMVKTYKIDNDGVTVKIFTSPRWIS